MRTRPQLDRAGTRIPLAALASAALSSAVTALAALAVPGLAGSSGPPPDPVLAAQVSPVAAHLLREIRAEVLSIGGYPGEDFVRGEFFLGEGDDDTNKTHAVGILIKDDDTDGSSRLTVVVSRLEPSPRGEPRVQYARDPKTVVCTFAGGAGAVELVRSDYPAADLEKLLTEILRAVRDKKALLKKTCFFRGVSQGGEGIRLEDSRPWRGDRQGAESAKRPSAPPRRNTQGRLWEKLRKELSPDISQESSFVNLRRIPALRSRVFAPVGGRFPSKA